MTGQLALVDVPTEPKLTPRQQRALELVTATGPDGLHSDELGAMLHEERGKHTRHERCQFDGSNGNQILRALRSKRLVKYRRGTPLIPGYWVAAGENGKPGGTTGGLQDGWQDLLDAGF